MKEKALAKWMKACPNEQNLSSRIEKLTIVQLFWLLKARPNQIRKGIPSNWDIEDSKPRTVFWSH